MDEFGPVAILCGGRGTRLQEHTREIPKALVEIGGKPILWHVIRTYTAHGATEFLLLTGYLSDLIERYVDSEQWPAGVRISCVETGLDTPTGGRVHAAAGRIGERSFSCTYADGVADIDLAAHADFHRNHGGVATMTVVRPYVQWGVADLDGDDRVAGFREKPRLEHWVNGGFFRFEPAVFEHLEPSSVLEQRPLAGLAAADQLYAYRHQGFWDCMDTYKDAVVLNDLWAGGDAPWRCWDEQPAGPDGAPA